MTESRFYDLLKDKGMRPIDVARKLGVDKSVITRWAQGKIPLERVPAVSEATGISREELRPDYFGATQ